MTNSHNSTTQPQPVSLAKRMMIGAGIGLTLIAFFLISAGEGNPEWGKYWMTQPLFMMAFAGAMGGLCNYIAMRYHSQFGLNKRVALFLSIVVFIIGLYMGFVLGLNGTYWN
jgi:hypothetical protein